jgi:hypothetical protein
MKNYLWFKYAIIGMFAVSFYLILFDAPRSEAPQHQRVVSAADQGHTTVSTGRLRMEQIEKAMQQSKTAEELERALNSSDIRGDNMDLTGDGKPDYIHVTEVTEPAGFQLALHLPDNQRQEIARISVTPQNNGGAAVQYQGQTPYFAGPSSHSSIWPSVGTGLILGYLWGRHTPYHSPYSYGSYPSHFSSRPQTSAYNSRSMAPSAHKAPIQQPLRSQRGFQPKSRFAPSRSGGFGRRR